MSDRRIHWRCFHCGDGFTKAQERWAREHFGATELETPVCLIRTAGEGALLTALRNAQDELDRYHAEDTDLIRAMYAMRSDHAQALIREEERGYNKGVTDARAEGLANWRPIADAKRDGRMILAVSRSRMGELYDPERPFTCWWKPYDPNSYGNTEREKRDGGSWLREAKTSSRTPNYVCYPTHFLAFEPPAEELP